MAKSRTTDTFHKKTSKFTEYYNRNDKRGKSIKPFVDEDIAFADTINVGIKLMGLAGVEIVISQMIGYDGLFLIDLTDNSRKTIYNHCVTGEEYFDEEKYSESFSRYINNFVFESDREEVLKYA